MLIYNLQTNDIELKVYFEAPPKCLGFFLVWVQLFMFLRGMILLSLLNYVIEIGGGGGGGVEGGGMEGSDGIDRIPPSTHT